MSEATLKALFNDFCINEENFMTTLSGNEKFAVFMDGQLKGYKTARHLDGLAGSPISTIVYST